MDFLPAARAGCFVDGEADEGGERPLRAPLGAPGLRGGGREGGGCAGLRYTHLRSDGPN